MKRFFVSAIAGLMAVSAVNAQQYSLSSDWTTGAGSYVIIDDGGNNVLFTTAIDGTDPKHAWVEGDFGTDYTVTCDVRMDTWRDGEDLSRAGIAVRIQPGDSDEGHNILLHDTFGNVEFLNDRRGWADDTAFAWTTGEWYTMQIGVSGDILSGQIYPVGSPDQAVVLADWDSAPSGARADGFPGITPSTLIGLSASYDNFTVTDPAGNVLFSDDFETPGPEVSNVAGLSPSWTAGEGLYFVQDGVLVTVAQNGADPKHAWVNEDFGTFEYTVRSDVRIDSWADAEDLSRAGIASRIQPGDSDEGINILLHDTIGNVEFLNDRRGWADDTAFAWEVGSWYTMEITVLDDGTTTGSIAPVGSPDQAVVLNAWDSAGPGGRDSGFPGITPSTLFGLVASYDNFEVEVGGSVVFSDDFETFFETSNVNTWELYN